MSNKAHRTILLALLIVAYTIIIVFCGIPLLIVMIRSFFTNKLSSDDVFVGFQNYISIFSDDVFWQAMGNSFILLSYIPLLMVLSLCMAVFLREGFRFSSLYKAIIVFPEVVASLTVASIFSCLFGYNGPMNGILQLLNMTPVYWLGNKTSAFIVIILCIIYTSFGWQTMIFSSALTTVPPELYYLMMVDGVGWFRRIRIYMYEIRRTIIHSLLLNLIYGFSGFFSIIYTLTNGGPGYKTTTVDFLIYLRAFKYGRELSSAYTIAAVLFLVVMFLVSLLYLLLRKETYNS